MSLESILKKIPLNVQWHEGMLLSSQHFQTSDYYHRSINNFIGKCANIFNYGLINFIIDESSLTSGIIKIKSIQGLLEDGTILNYESDTENYSLELNIKEILDNKNQVKIYIGVFKHSHGNDNYNSDIPRYFSVLNEDVKDENTGENPINIPSQKPKFILISEYDLSSNISALPIIEIVKKNNVFIKSDFIPPYIYITNNCELYKMISNIVTNSKEKIGYILSKKNLTKDNYIIDSALRILIAFSISIESILNTNYVSPFELYKLVLGFTTNLVSFAISNIVPVLPSYDHLNPVLSFKVFEEHIDKSLNQIIEFSSAIPFIIDNNTFKLKLILDWKEKKELLIGIRRSNKTSKDEFITWVNGAQIASESMIEDIKQKRVLGANRDFIDSSEIGFENIESDLIIIKINSDSSYIKFGENLCIFNTSYSSLPEEIVFFPKESF